MIETLKTNWLLILAGILIIIMFSYAPILSLVAILGLALNWNNLKK
jgi:hypothetical protein